MALFIFKRHPNWWVAVGLFLLTYAGGYAFTLVTPPFEGPDEYYHYCYVALIARDRSLPAPYPITPVPYTDRHPPLYYILSAFLVLDLPVSCYQAPPNPFAIYDHSTPINDNRNVTAFSQKDLQAVDVTGLRRVRLFSVFLGGLTIVIIYQTARIVFGNDILRAAFAALVIVALPPFLWLSGFVNNDNLAILFGALFLFLSLKLVEGQSITPWQTLGVGVLMGAGLMTKFNLWIYGPILLVIVAHRSYHSTGLRQTILNSGLFLGGLLLVSAWWFVRNAWYMPELAGLQQLSWLGPIRWQISPTLETLWITAKNQWTGVWARYGYQVELPNWVENAGFLLVFLAICGLLRKLSSVRLKAFWNRPVVWVGAVGGLNFLSGLYAVLISQDAGQGRFLYPGIGSFALLLVLGWTQLWPRKAKVWGTVLGMAVAIVSALMSFMFVYRTAYQLPELRSADALPAGIEPYAVSFGNVVELIGASVSPTRISAGAKFSTTVCWKPLRNNQDVAMTLEVLDPQSAIVVDRTTLPGLGRYRSLDWEIGMIFCDALTLNTPPTIPTQTQYRVVVKVVGQQAIDATGAPVGLVVIGNLAVNSSGSELPADFVPVEASLEHEIVLLGYTANYSAADTGSVSDLNLFWKIQTELPESYHVFVHWIDAEGQMIAQSDGIPRNGLYPTDAWAIGEVIPDSYRLVSSGAVDLEQSRFLVGMYEYPSGQRLLTFGPLALDNAFSFPALETPR